MSNIGRPLGYKRKTVGDDRLSSFIEKYELTGALTYRDAAEILRKKTNHKFGLGMLHRLAHGQEPKSPRLRRLLNLPTRDNVLLDLLGILWGAKK